LCPCPHSIALILDPPPSTLPMCKGIGRPLRYGLGCPAKAQSGTWMPCERLDFDEGQRLHWLIRLDGGFVFL
jgi:hypothetical protein